TSVHVLSQQELKKVPVTAQDDLLRSLQIIPGIVSSADVSSKFYVRGGAGDQNLIYLDGMKIYNPYHAFGIFSIFDPDFVKTTEVYTGAFPAGYGGRLSSVVNIVSRNGNNSEMKGSAGINFISGKLQLEGPLSKNDTWIVNARKSLFNDTFKKFLRDPAPISFYDIFAKVNFGGADYGRQSIQTFLSGDDILAPKATEADHRWRMSAYAFTFSDLVDERIYVDAVLYGSSFSIVRDAKQSTAVRDAESSIKDGGIRGELTIYTESKDLYFIGFDVNIPSYRYTFSTSSNLNIEVQDVAVETWAWFRYQLNYDRLKADLGVHSDVISLFDGKHVNAMFQPRLNLSYLLESDWRVKLSYGVYSQNLITLTNEDDIISLFEAWIYIPDNTQPEIATHYVAGLEGNIFSELSLNVQTYYKDYSSLVLYNREKKYAIDPDYINGSGSSYGVETLFRYKYSFLDLYLAYTIGWTSLNINAYTFAPRYDRRHNLNIMNIARITESFDLGFRWEFGSGYPYTQTVSFYDRLSLGDIGRTSFQNESGRPYSVLGEKNSSRLPSYHRLDIIATYKYSTGNVNGSLGLSITNVYNNDNILFYDRKTLQKITMLPFLPSASLKVDF
ncbi:MAG: TonB-dependent receptor plug domain-containing protein, partial [Bacteriovoracaceae bacterium]